MIQAYLYFEEENEIVEQLKFALEKFSSLYPNQVHSINTSKLREFKKVYQTQLPFLEIGPYRLIMPISNADIEFALKQTAIKIKNAEERNDKELIKRFTEAPEMKKKNRAAFWFTKHYMFVFNLIVFIYIGLPFLAPILMKANLPNPAKTIYKIYTPLCHQLPFRSFFLFGEQPVYPRALAGLENYETFNEASGMDEDDLLAARTFIGNETMGYKIALCQRDIGIYLAILLFGVIFSLFSNKIKAVPWWVWIIFGLVPVGLDGFSQMLSQTNLALFSWLPLRESTPFLRVLTGGLFGLFTAWFGYPYVRESINESKDQIVKEMAFDDHQFKWDKRQSKEL